jgi:hypothetical protein
MNKIFNSEVVAAVAGMLQKAFPQLQRNENVGMSAVHSDPPASDQPASGILVFIGNLLSNSAFSGFLGDGRPEGAVLRGSLVGLASGVDAVTDDNAAGKSQVKQRPLLAALTVCAYVAGGIIAAMIYREMRRSTQATPI